MCLAIYKPAGVSVDPEHLTQAFRENPDGAGIAWATGNRVKIVKGLWSPKAVRKLAKRYQRHAMAIHFRWATHGVVSKANCHPFRISEDLAVVHNGIIPGFGTTGQSDTAEFTDVVLKYYHQDGILERPEVLRDLAEWIGAGSKLVILRADGRAHLINEGAGHWAGGCWYSNHSYLPSSWGAGFATGTSYRYPKSWFARDTRWDSVDLCDWCGESRGAGNCVCHPRDSDLAPQSDDEGGLWESRLLHGID